MSILMIVFILYLCLVLTIGVVTSRYTKTLKDYILGGRKMGVLPVSLSAEASDMSGWIAMGLPGAIYSDGVGGFIGGIGCAIGTFINWTGISKRLRKYTGELGAMTVPDYIERRFKDESHLLKEISAAFILIFMTAYVSAMLTASGKLLGTVFGIDYRYAVLLSIAIVVVYTFLGGFFAVSWTDVLQGLIMAFGLLMIGMVGLVKVGGFAPLFESVHSIDPSLLSPLGGYAGIVVIMFIFGHFSWVFGYPGQPHIITRFMSMKDPKQNRHCTLMGMMWVLICLWGTMIAGLIGLTLLPGLEDPDLILINLSGNMLPEWLAAIFIAAIVAAIMSTCDSQLLVSSSAFTKDIYHLLKPEASQRSLVWLNRAMVVIVGAIATIMAFAGGFVYHLVGFAWGGFAAVFGPVIVLSLWWKRTTKWGTLCSMIVGGVTVVLWKYFVLPTLPVWLPGMVPGFILAIVVNVVVSSVTAPPEGAEKEFEFIS